MLLQHRYWAYGIFGLDYGKTMVKHVPTITCVIGTVDDSANWKTKSNPELSARRTTTTYKISEFVYSK